MDQIAIVIDVNQLYDVFKNKWPNLSEVEEAFQVFMSGFVLAELNKKTHMVDIKRPRLIINSKFAISSN